MDFPDRTYLVWIDEDRDKPGRFHHCMKMEDEDVFDYQQYIRSDLVPQWQPFDTAPTNVQILVRRSDHVEERSGDICTAIVYNVERDIKFFTHWMPIPKVPE